MSWAGVCDQAQTNIATIQDHHKIPAMKEEVRQAMLTQGSDLQRSSQELEDLKARHDPKDGKAITAKTEEVQQISDRQKSYAANNLQAAAEARQSAQKLRQAELDKITDLYDVRIAGAKAQGKDTAKLEYQKQQDLLTEQKEQAESLHDDVGAAHIQTVIDANKAERYGPDSPLAKGRQGVEAGKLRNAALLKGDVNGANTVDDAAGLLEQRRQYKALNLSPEMADEDFKDNIRAQATLQAPKITADSLQAVGGGGGFSASDPRAAAEERIRRLTEQQKDLLSKIVELLAPDPAED